MGGHDHWVGYLVPLSASASATAHAHHLSTTALRIPSSTYWILPISVHASMLKCPTARAASSRRDCPSPRTSPSHRQSCGSSPQCGIRTVSGSFVYRCVDQPIACTCSLRRRERLHLHPRESDHAVPVPWSLTSAPFTSPPTILQHPPGEDQYGYEESGERWLPVHTVESIVRLHYPRPSRTHTDGVYSSSASSPYSPPTRPTPTVLPTWTPLRRFVRIRKVRLHRALLFISGFC